MKKDIAIIGGSLGGVMAAIGCASQGKSVYLCEETDWLGGQLTSQAVPPDEHKWIEHFGCTKTYREFRNRIRDYYRNHEQASDELKMKETFCPGNSWVSRIAHEPKVAVDILNEMIEPYRHLIQIDYFTVATDSVVENDVIKSVTVSNKKNGEVKVVFANYYLDATDCGDLLPIVKAEYRTGAESNSETNEPHAPEIADSTDLQPITWVVALELDADGDYKIEKPEMYDYFKELVVPYADCNLLSWYGPDALTQDKCEFSFYDYELGENRLGFWSYRRIIDSRNYKDGRKEVSLINWPENDFYLGNIYDDENAEKNKELAKQQTMSVVYWLQNEAPRQDGKKGYPVKLRPDIMGTKDGLAKAPYIRESRRIVAQKIVREQDVSKKTNNHPPVFEDSVGVGHYAIDIHLTTKSHTFLYDSVYPFEIPLSAMIPIRLKNLIPACKNIGCTHLTNGCYRLHPVEWNIGEVAGLLSAYCVENSVTPLEVYQNHLKDFQDFIQSYGVQLHWDFDKMEI